MSSGSSEDEDIDLTSANHEPNSAMGFLHEMQIAFLRMILGIGRFLFRTLPRWIADLCSNAVKVTVKAVGVLLVAAVWALFVFGPGVAAYVMEALGNPWTAGGVGLWSLIATIGSFRSLAKMRSKSGSVGCVWAVGVAIVIAACVLLVLAHLEQSGGKSGSTPGSKQKSKNTVW